MDTKRSPINFQNGTPLENENPLEEKLLPEKPSSPQAIKKKRCSRSSPFLSTIGSETQLPFEQLLLPEKRRKVSNKRHAKTGGKPCLSNNNLLPKNNSKSPIHKARPETFDAKETSPNHKHLLPENEEILQNELPSHEHHSEEKHSNLPTIKEPKIVSIFSNKVFSKQRSPQKRKRREKQLLRNQIVLNDPTYFVCQDSLPIKTESKFSTNERSETFETNVTGNVDNISETGCKELDQSQLQSLNKPPIVDQLLDDQLLPNEQPSLCKICKKCCKKYLYAIQERASPLHKTRTVTKTKTFNFEELLPKRSRKTLKTNHLGNMQTTDDEPSLLNINLLLKNNNESLTESFIKSVNVFPTNEETKTLSETIVPNESSSPKQQLPQKKRNWLGNQFSENKQLLVNESCLQNSYRSLTNETPERLSKAMCPNKLSLIVKIPLVDKTLILKEERLPSQIDNEPLLPSSSQTMKRRSELKPLDNSPSVDQSHLFDEEPLQVPKSITKPNEDTMSNATTEPPNEYRTRLRTRQSLNKSMDNFDLFPLEKTSQTKTKQKLDVPKATIKYYCEQKVKKTSCNLETIYEEPNGNNIMSKNKIKRCINFPKNLPYRNKAVIRKRAIKAKKIPQYRNIKKISEKEFEARLNRLGL